MTAHEFLDKEYFYLILDSRDTDIYPEDIGKAMADFARYKCKELLLLVAEKAKVEEVWVDYCVDKDSIINVVDLETFCS